jgi:hypothetical protein
MEIEVNTALVGLSLLSAIESTLIVHFWARSRRFELLLDIERRRPWEWTRQPRGYSPPRGGLRFAMFCTPDPPPMPGMGRQVIPYLDLAAQALSRYMVSPTDANRAVQDAEAALTAAKVGIVKVSKSLSNRPPPPPTRHVRDDRNPATAQHGEHCED